MKPAIDPDADYKGLVRRGYDTCARSYQQVRASEAATELQLLYEHMPAPASVLDLGCGSGVPIAKALAERYRVTGIDFSREQVQLARKAVPAATFVEADLASVQFPSASFDAVVAFYVLFHLPRRQQLDVLASIGDWLKPGGYFLGTLSHDNESPYTEDDFFGVEMYWTNFALDEYLAILADLGFEVLDSRTVGHGFEDGRQDEQHPLVFAQKSGTPRPEWRERWLPDA